MSDSWTPEADNPSPDSDKAFEDVLENALPCINCGINADAADGFGQCTCGNEQITRELLAAHQAAVTAAEVALLRNLKLTFRGEDTHQYRPEDIVSLGLVEEYIDDELRQRGAL